MPAPASKAKGCQAGHKGCQCKLLCCAITPERVEAIKASALSGTHWAEYAHPGAACECGLRSSRYCHRHQKELNR
jgi:hypothetical protein